MAGKDNKKDNKKDNSPKYENKETRENSKNKKLDKEIDLKSEKNKEENKPEKKTSGSEKKTSGSDNKKTSSSDKKTSGSDKKEKKNENDGPNKATSEAGLMFNVNSFRNWMKEQFNVKEQEMPKFNGAHVALTACIEEMLKLLLKTAVGHLPKDKANLYELSKGAIGYMIQIDEDLKRVFRYHLEKYDDEENYTSSYIVNKETMSKFIDKYFGKNIKLTNEGYNLVVYLLNKFAISVTRYSKELLSYAEKRSLRPKTVISAVKLICPESISNVICMRVEDACKMMTEDEDSDENKKKSKKDDENDDENDDDDNENDDDDNDDDDDDNENDDDDDVDVDDNDDNENDDDDKVSDPEEESDDEDKSKHKKKEKNSKSKKNSK